MLNDCGSSRPYNDCSVPKLSCTIIEIALGESEIIFLTKLLCVMESGAVEHDLTNNGTILKV
jgi:hypothetical protein